MTFGKTKRKKQEKDMGKLELTGMVFWSHHGCFEEERTIGNRFVVDFEAFYEMRVPSETDNIADAANYQEIYHLIRREMEQPSHLLEHVARRILEAVRSAFPELCRFSVSVAKINPPLGGEVGASRVTLYSDELPDGSKSGSR